MRVTLLDGRQLSAQLLAFDKHMNLVLADTQEFRTKRKQTKTGAPGASAAQTIEQEEKRTLGLTIVRGAHIVSVSVESPPPADPSTRLGKPQAGGISSTLAAGPGVARAAGRGAAPISLAGPAAGVGVGGAAPPAPFPGFPGAPPPGFPGRGGREFEPAPALLYRIYAYILAAPPPGFPGAFPPAGFPGNAPFPPPGFPSGGGPPPSGFNPPPRR